MKALVAATLTLGLVSSLQAAPVSVDATAPGRGSAPALPPGLSSEAFPVVVEMNFAETPASEWPAELAKIKAAGVDLVATPVLWRFHEANPGVFSWKGDLDIGQFAKACQAAHLGVILRPAIGSEVEEVKGGAPDWWRGSGDLAQAIKPFLASLEGSLEAAQSKDAVVALQWGADAPIEALRGAALSAHLDTPVTLTVGPAIGAAADDTSYPLHRLAIVTADPRAPSTSFPEVFQFRDSHSARAGEMLDVGSLSTYIRRPYLGAADVYAAAVVALGSGNPLAWYERFHGGTRYAPIRPRTLVDSPTNRPILNNDAQAPISNAGELRPVYAELKQLDWLIHDFGRDLGSMPSFVGQPLSEGRGPPLNWAVRTHGKSGFLFINTYGREVSGIDHPAVQFQVQLPGETLTVPMLPTKIAGQVSAIWPINIMLGGVRLQYATAQPLCRLGPWFVFFAVNGIAPEFMFDRSTLAPGQNWHIAVFKGDLDTTIDVTSKGGLTAHILVLSQGQAALSWRVMLDGRPHLVLTGPLTSADNVLHVSLSPANATPLLVMPSVDFGQPSTAHGPFAQYSLPAGPAIGALPPINFDPKFDTQASNEDILHGRPPTALEFDRAQHFSMRLPSEDTSAQLNPTLVVKFQGDAARLYLGNRMISDAFYDGSDWRIQVRQFMPQILTEPLTFKFIGAKPNAPLGLDRNMNPWFGSELPTAPIRVRLYNEVTRTLDLTPVHSGN